MENLAKLTIDREQCIGCGKCVRTCPSGIFYLDEQKKAAHIEIKEFGWDGCWKCQHCLAVCPAGAVSVLEKRPENSLLPPDRNISGSVMDALVVNRRSHRRYLKKNVDRSLIRYMLEILQNAPNGGNKSQVEYTLIDDMEQMDRFRNLVYQRMDQLAAGYGYCLRVFRTVMQCSRARSCYDELPGRCAETDAGSPEHAGNSGKPLFWNDGFPEFSYTRGVQKKDELKVHRLRFT